MPQPSLIMVTATSPRLVLSLLELSAHLLLVSGDVESNPGPGTQTAEYETMKECTHHFTYIFKEDLLNVSDLMFQNNLIGGQLREELSSQYVPKHKKAADLFDHLLELVKLNEKMFSKYMKVLSELGLWISEILEPVNKMYAKKQASQATRQQQYLQQQAPPTDHDSRINDIATKVGIDPNLLDNYCGEGHIEKISHKIVHWNAYARYLGLTDQEENAISLNPTLAAPNAKPLEMLRIWQDKLYLEPAGRYRYLLRGCLELESNARLVGDICGIIRDHKPTYQSARGSQQPIDQPQHSLSSQPQSLVMTGPSSQQPHQEGGKKPIQEEEEEPKKNICVPVPVEQNPGKQFLPQDSVDSDVGHAQVATDKLWSKDKDSLLVYFLNPNDLYSVGLNELNIISWANVWETQTNQGIVPNFRITQDIDRAQIRVKINPYSGSWSKIGTDAGSVMNPRKPTMTLGLLKGNSDYNRHTTIHEFGHALGLEHEHQRSKFWNIAEKFLNIEAMRRDPALSGTNLKCDFLEAQQHGAGSAEYDQDSIMHYWFDVGWLTTRKYHDASKVKRDNKLSPDEKKVILGIHTRHHKLADRPSSTDFAFLEKCYRDRGTSVPRTSPASPAASGRPPPATATLPDQDDEVASMSDESDSEPKSKDHKVSQPAQSMSHNLQHANRGQLVYNTTKPASPHYIEQEQRFKQGDGSYPLRLNESSRIVASPSVYTQPPQPPAMTPHGIQGTAQNNAPYPTNRSTSSSGSVLGQPSDQASEGATASAQHGESELPSAAFSGTEDIELDAAITVRDQLPQLVTELSRIAQEAQEMEIVEELQQLQSHWESNVIKIGVIGATNSGKSTTINAILNGKYLPASSGGTTARVVCIKSDPEASECQLSDSQQVSLALGKEEIHKRIERLNSEQRAAGEEACCQSLLHIRISRSFNIKCLSGCCIEIFDTPGMSEDKEAAIYKDAKKALDQMDGIVIVLSQDTAVLRETTQLLKFLHECYPDLLDTNSLKRAVVLMNKFDLLFEEDEDAVAEKKKEIASKLKIPLEDILFYSAKMGFESRMCRSDSHSIPKKRFNKLSKLVDDIDQVTEEINQYSDFNPVNVEKVATIVEQCSNIKEVEKRVNSLLPGLKDRKVASVLRKVTTKLGVHAHLTQKLCDIQRRLEQVRFS